MSAVFTSLLPVFLLIALGFSLRHWRVVPEDMWRGIELLGYWVFFPSLLTLTMIRADLAAIEISSISASMVAAFCTISALLIIGRRPLSSVLNMSAPAYTSLYQSSVRWNGFVALPVAVELYGSTGATIVAIIMAWLVPLANAAAVAVLARYADTDQNPNLKRTLYIVFRNPFIWATMIGLAINLGGVEIYKPFRATMEMLAGAAIASGLLMVGSGLQLKDAMAPNRAAIAGTFMKLIAMPLIVIAWATLFDVTGTALVVCVICASVPTAMNAYLLARQMGGDAPLQATTTSLQTLLSFLTIPALIWLVQT